MDLAQLALACVLLSSVCVQITSAHGGSSPSSPLLRARSNADFDSTSDFGTDFGSSSDFGSPTPPRKNYLDLPHSPPRSPTSPTSPLHRTMSAPAAGAAFEERRTGSWDSDVSAPAAIAGGRNSPTWRNPGADDFEPISPTSSRASDVTVGSVDEGDAGETPAEQLVLKVQLEYVDVDKIAALAEAAEIATQLGVEPTSNLGKVVAELRGLLS